MNEHVVLHHNGAALVVAEKTGYQDYSYLDTLSLAYHLTGDSAQAIENQKKAIALLPEGPSGTRTAMEESLAEFEAASHGPKTAPEERSSD